MLFEHGMTVNDRRKCGNDTSTVVQNYVCSDTEKIDFEILDLLFDSGFEPNLIVSDNGETVGEKIWNNSDEAIQNYVRNKLGQLGFTGKTN